MKNKNFDKTIKDKLEQLEPGMPFSAWEQFAQKLDADEVPGQPEPESQSIDDVVYEKLYPYEKPYNPEHWSQFTHRLDEEFSLWHRLYRYKVAEVSLMLLLIFTVGQFIPSTSVLKTDFKKTTPKHNPPAAPLPTLKKDKPLEQATLTPTTRESLDAALESVKSMVTGVSSSDLQSETTAAATAFTSDTVDMAQRKRAVTPSIPPLSGKSLVQDPPVLAEKKNEKAAITGIGLQMDNSNPNMGLLSAIPVFSTEVLLNGTSYDALLMKGKPNKKPRRLRVGMFASANIDHIMTPYDDVFDFDPYSRFALGYGGGFSVGWQSGRFEFSTGLIYGVKRYQPVPHVIVYDDGQAFFAESLFSVELNTVQLPVHVKYAFVSGDKWHVYGVAGSSVHVAVQANYDVRRAEISSPLNRPDDIRSLKSRPATPQSDDLLQKKFADGWFSGGTFGENSFFSVDMGVGLEYYFSHRWSVYLQPTYLQRLNIFEEGIGPNQDRINSTNILIGAKVGF